MEVHTNARKSFSPNIIALSCNSECCVSFFIKALTALSEQFVDDRSNLYRASKERVTELAGLLHTHPGPAAIERRLWQMWDTRFSSLGPDRSLAARRAEQRRFLLALDALVTPAQRAHMLEEIDDRLEQAISFQLPPES